MKTQTIQAHLRPATPDDVPALEALLPRLIVGLAPWRDEALWLKATRRSLRSALRGKQSRGTLLVASDDDERLLGFISSMRDATWSGEPQLYIGDLVVTPEAEGQGVARALLDAAERQARALGVRFVALDVHADNAHARAVYRHCGFAEESLRLVKALEERATAPSRSPRQGRR